MDDTYAGFLGTGRPEVTGLTEWVGRRLNEADTFFKRLGSQRADCPAEPSCYCGHPEPVFCEVPKQVDIFVCQSLMSAVSHRQASIAARNQSPRFPKTQAG